MRNSKKWLKLSIPFVGFIDAKEVDEAEDIELSIPFVGFLDMVSSLFQLQAVNFQFHLLDSHKGLATVASDGRVKLFQFHLLDSKWR